MKNIILRKEDGKTTQKVRESMEDLPYMTPEENYFIGLINQNKVDEYAQDDIQIYNKDMIIMISEIFNNNEEAINKMYNIIRHFKKRLDLQELLDYFLLEYSKVIYERYKSDINVELRIKEKTKKIKKDFEMNFDVLMSLLIKNVVRKYYSLLLSDFDKERINALGEMRLNNLPVEYIYQELGIDFDRRNLFDKFSSKILMSKIDKDYNNIQDHLCWLNCENATVKKCPKIADRSKKRIDRYDFITDGYQIISENGVDTFVVTKCTNYLEEIPKKLTKEDIIRLKKVREDIYMNYFNAASTKEAKSIEKHLVKTGQIVRKNINR